MVKKSIPKKPAQPDAPAKDSGGRPPRNPETLRTERLVMRVHPDFLRVVTERAEEQRLTRSRFVEEMLRGFLAMDPRNPRFDINGKIDPRAPTARQRQLSNPLHFLQMMAAHSGLTASVYPQPGGFVQPPGWEPSPEDE
ncbi:MAG: hypothetical protein JWQ83_1153 [Lacunisphaera sp.]|nr:hypothetical protein [Lacunisphaera sp.]